MHLNIIILAAGRGTRMKSSKPKVLHELAGKPLLWHVLTTASSLKPKNIYVVCGYGHDQLKQTFNHFSEKIHWIYQEQQKGTAHAVSEVLPTLDKTVEKTLILYGDMPLISAQTLQNLLSLTKQTGDMALLTAVVDEPSGFGRIIRNDQNAVIQIVEQKDLKNNQKYITEINTGILALSTKQLFELLPQIGNSNAQNEYYLTDLIALFYHNNNTIHPLLCDNLIEAKGVNTRLQLGQIERDHQMQQVEKLMEQGVSFYDLERVDIRGNLTTGSDVTIDVNTIFIGDVYLADNCYIGPNSVITNSQIGKNTRIEANCVIDGSTIENDCTIGPFARLRPGTELKNHVEIGNFVELKKAKLADHVKAGHLSYLGDVNIGKYTNIGAGTITCNYDGVNKHLTEIGENVFIGSNTLLRAPVHIGDNAATGAGAVIRHDVESGTLAITWQEQRTRDWYLPDRKKH